MMDSSHVDQADKSSPETSSDSSLSAYSPNLSDIFGEPQVHPRVGDEYQVEIPSLHSKSELLQLMKNPADSEGLPIPVVWVCNQASIIKERIECLDSPYAFTNGFVDFEESVGKSHISSVKQETNINGDVQNQSYSLVPGQAITPWSDLEADCFLLGLYFFGKNLLLVMKFMESKGLGQILAYYYGCFYGSSGYRKWSECRKMKNKKCVLGHKFFTGYRQHELFLRLSPHLSEESKINLLEVSKAFAEGRTTLDEYVFSLKALVGIHALVKAIGIGKEKEDLTTFILDGSKNSQMLSHRPEIPSGKACSSLTCAEIVRYLTGDFRLSKARSNDLFWEAVWPRLLERGWHSEQPKGDGYAGSKNCLVFLMPGIKKFSRRKLSKGDDYFDSISDVLAKVSSEPELLVLEGDEDKPSSSKVENGWAIEVKSDDDQDSSDHERHCYLKPRVSSEIANLHKFTVIDTSLAYENNPSKMRELRSLPLEAKRCSFRKIRTGSVINTNTVKNDLQCPTLFTQSDESKCVAGGSGIIPGSSNLEHQEKPPGANLLVDHKSRTIKHQFSRRAKSGPSNCSVTKRRRFTCAEEELTCVLSLPAITNKKKAATSRAMMTNNTVPSGLSQSDNLKVIPTDSFIAGTSSEKILQDECFTGVCSDTSREMEKMPEIQTVINLNLPPVPFEPESDRRVKLVEGEHNDLLLCSASVDPANRSGDSGDLQPRRQSTRNRPLTTKALEALEFGFLNPARTYKKRSPAITLDQKSKRARQPRSSSMFPPVMDFEVRAAANENCNGKTDTLTNATPTEKAVMTCELLGLPETSFSPAASSKEMFT